MHWPLMLSLLSIVVACASLIATLRQWRRIKARRDALDTAPPPPRPQVFHPGDVVNIPAFKASPTKLTDRLTKSAKRIELEKEVDVLNQRLDALFVLRDERPLTPEEKHEIEIILRDLNNRGFVLSMMMT